jgi:hypothetical protein
MIQFRLNCTNNQIILFFSYLSGIQHFQFRVIFNFNRNIPQSFVLKSAKSRYLYLFNRFICSKKLLKIEDTWFIFWFKNWVIIYVNYLEKLRISWLSFTLLLACSQRIKEWYCTITWYFIAIEVKLFQSKIQLMFNSTFYKFLY